MLSVDSTFIGERTHPDDEEGINKARYHLASQYTHEKEVLDIGCGSGYGSAILAAHGQPKKITAIDKEAKAIEYAKKIHNSTLITFINGSLEDQSEQSFEVITAFEIIEHIQADNEFVAQLRRIVRPDGLVLISTPNKLISSPHTDTPPNPYHVREYTPEQFTAILQKHFGHVEMYALALKNNEAVQVERSVHNSLIWRICSAIVQNRTMRSLVNLFPRDLKRMITGEHKIQQKAEDFELTQQKIEIYPYLYALCRP